MSLRAPTRRSVAAVGRNRNALVQSNFQHRVTIANSSRVSYRDMAVPQVLRRLARKVARAYHLQCAREDLRKWRVVIPSGVWRCDHCSHVAFDITRLRAHMKLTHA